MTDTKLADFLVREALQVALQVLEIASDWNAPTHYDIEIRPGWEDTVDPDSNEPTWPTLYRIIKKCKQALDA